LAREGGKNGGELAGLVYIYAYIWGVCLCVCVNDIFIYIRYSTYVQTNRLLLRLVFCSIVEGGEHSEVPI
jgi:hypothetical protein